MAYFAEQPNYASSGRQRDTPRMMRQESRPEKNLHPEELAELTKRNSLGRQTQGKQVKFDIYKNNPNPDVKPGMEWMHDGPKVNMGARAGNGKPTVVSNSVDDMLGDEVAEKYNRRLDGGFTAQQMAEARRVRAHRTNASDPQMLGREKTEWENKRHAPAPDLLAARQDPHMQFNSSHDTHYCMHTDTPIYYDHKNLPAPRLAPRPAPSFVANAHNFDVGTDAEYMGQKRYFTNNMMPEHKELVRPEPARYRLDDDVPLGMNATERTPIPQRESLANSMPKFDYNTYNTKVQLKRRAHDEPTSLW